MAAPLSRSFLKDNLVVLGGHVLIYLKGIFLIPLIIKTVGVSIYGGFTLLSSYLGFFYGLSSWGAGIKAMRYLPSAQERSRRQALFFPQFYFQALSLSVLSLGMILVDPVVQPLLFKGEVHYTSSLIPFYLLTYFLYTQGADYFRYTSRVQVMILVTLIFPYLHLVLIWICFAVLHSLEINQLIILHGLAALAVALPCLYFVGRELGVCVLFFKARELRANIRLGFPLVINFIVDFILSGIDRYFIAFYLSVKAVGYYSPAYALGSLIAFVPKAMGTALPQLLSQAIDSEQQFEAQRMLDYALKIFLLLAIPFVLGALVLDSHILSLLANQEVARQARGVVPLVALGTLFYGLNMLLMNIFFVRLETDLILKLNLMAALFNVVSNCLLLFYFPHIIIAAATTLLSYLLVFVFLLRIVSQRWRVGWPWPELAKALCAGLVMAGCVWALTKLDLASLVWSSLGWSRQGWGGPGVNLSLELLAGLTVYCLCLLALKTFSRQEISFVKETIFKKR